MAPARPSGWFRPSSVCITVGSIYILPAYQLYGRRYVFLVFNQTGGFDGQTLVNASTSILNFNLSSFAEAVGLGDPIAGTYMLVGPNV